MFLTALIRLFVAAALGLFLPTESCLAFDLFEETDYGAYELYQSGSGSVDFGHSLVSSTDPDDDPLSLTVSGSYLKTTESLNDQSIIDETTSYSANLAWLKDNLSLDSTLSYATTPAENLSVFGTQLAGGYRWVYDVQSTPKKWVSLRMIFQDSGYVASYSGQVPRKKNKTKVVEGISELGRRVAGLAVGWKWNRSWRVNFEYDQDFYNRDVASFQSSLDSPRAVESGLSGFGSAVGGVPLNTTTLACNYDYVPDWTLGLSLSNSVLAADGTNSFIGRLSLTHQLTDSLEIAAGWISQSSDVTSENLAFVRVGYDSL